MGLYIVIALLTLYVISLFNGLIRSKNRVEYAYSGIDTILKKRLDLVPALVSAVKNYMAYEAETFERIVVTRNATRQQFMQSDHEISKGIVNLMITAENFPNLKSNKNFLQLQQSLSEVEEQLSAARRTYNAHVLIYNNKIESIPSNVIAKLMNYSALPMYALKESK